MAVYSEPDANSVFVQMADEGSFVRVIRVITGIQYSKPDANAVFVLITDEDEGLERV